MIRAWWFVAVPLVGLAEAGLHAKQLHDVVPDADWASARASVEKDLRADDQVLFAPAWADPVGRQAFGPTLVTMARAARSDDSRFARVFVVSIRGATRSEVAGWRATSREQRGAVAITVFENPAYRKIIDDLAGKVRPDALTVTRLDAADAETPCPWAPGRTQSGGTYYPAGMAIPGEKFQCPTTVVGVSVIQALDHSARRCILAAPPGAGGTLRLRFTDVAFGASLRGHHGIHYEAERHLGGAPVTIAFKHGDRTIGQSTHRDGQGWSGFEFDTAELEGKRGSLVVEISAANNTNRKYCFDADTR
jgi:hypothetical protein